MFFIQLIVGIILGFLSLYYVAQIFIPVFYCIPKSIFLVLKGELKPIAVLFWFWSPFFWIAVPFLVGYFSPSIVDTKIFKLLDNPTSSIIINLMVFVMIINTIFTRKGRNGAKEDFWNSMNKYRIFKTVEFDSLALNIFGAGLKLYDSKNYIEAILKFDEAINIIPKLREPYDKKALLKDAYYNRGCAKDELKDYIGAINDYNKSIELGSNNASEYLNRALANYELKNFSEAIIDYNTSIELDPNKDTAYLGRAMAKFNIGDKQGACLDWNKASELGNEHSNDMIRKYCV